MLLYVDNNYANIIDRSWMQDSIRMQINLLTSLKSGLFLKSSLNISCYVKIPSITWLKLGVIPY